jgi:hypothetical protein
MAGYSRHPRGIGLHEAFEKFACTVVGKLAIRAEVLIGTT